MAISIVDNKYIDFLKLNIEENIKIKLTCRATPEAGITQ